MEEYLFHKELLDFAMPVNIFVLGFLFWFFFKKKH